MNVYGRIVTRFDVRDAVIEHLQQWTPAYIGEVAVQRGKGRCDLPEFRSWRFSTDDIDTWPADQLPACIVVCPGLSEEPELQGNGIYDSEFAVGAGAVVSARDQESTDENVSIYTAALRAALLQHRSLGGFASGMRWIDEDAIPLLGFDDSRTIAGGRVIIGVKVDSVLDSYGGPKAVPDDPCVDPGDWGIVQATPLTTKESAQ